jgi:ABC-type Zn2+ transport system substrate-binding protein/surface adhesin
MSDHDHDHHHHDHSHETHPHQLQPPHEVFHDPKAGEVVRGWITNGGLSLSLHAMAFGKPEVWGHVLAGMAQQVASACAEMGHGTADANFDAIRKVLNEDLGKIAGQLSAVANKT